MNDESWCPLPAGWTEGDVDAGDVSLHYVRTGLAHAGAPSRPTVMLVHGFSDSARCWDRTAHVLAPSFDVVMIDARSHGQSSAASGDAGASVSDVAAVSDALGIDRPILAGHSIGARTVADLGAAEPDRVRALVLEDPPWRAAEEQVVESVGDGDGVDQRDAAVRSHLRELSTLTRAELLDRVRVQHPTWSDDDHPAWIDSKTQVRVDAAGLLQPMPWGPTVSNIGCPTLLLHGDPARDGIVTPAVAARVVALNPRVTARMIPDAGHNIRREQRAAFEAALSDFLRMATTT